MTQSLKTTVLAQAQMLDFYRQMTLIRHFEERVVELFGKGLIVDPPLHCPGGHRSWRYRGGEPAGSGLGHVPWAWADAGKGRGPEEDHG